MGQFTANEVPDAPPNATVIAYSDERVRENEYLRRAIRNVATNDTYTLVLRVPHAEVNRTKKDLSELPFYLPERSSSDPYDRGYYFEYRETIVHVQFVILD